MENTFEYTTIEQQIQKLKKQQLHFDDEENARERLKTYGYYNIINGYRDPYITRKYDQKFYLPNVTFEQIFHLFFFDQVIRDAVLLSMIDLEEHLRAATSEIIAEHFGSDYRQYLYKNNYRDRKVKDSHFSRNNILSIMTKTAETSLNQPIKYYRESHGIIPPWILFKGLLFGTLVNFIRLLKSPQRNALIRTLYASEVTDESLDSYKDFLSDTLAMCVEYRNLAAHGGRIYNYIPKSNIRAFENTSISPGLPQLLEVLRHFEYKHPYFRLQNEINSALDMYCSQYPEDVPRIEQTTGFIIEVEKQVWVNQKTNKYHSIPHCSGIQNVQCIPLNEAKSIGYIACKKCIKES